MLEQVASVTALCDHTLCMQMTDDFVASCLAFFTSTNPKWAHTGKVVFIFATRYAVHVAVDIAEEQTKLPL